MDWTKQTFWFEDAETHTKMAAVMESKAIEFLDWGQNIIPANEYAPCKECQHLNPCMNSIWNEGTRTSNPPGANVTVVHTCCTCGCEVLSSPDSSKEVPSGCPRWDRKQRNYECLACRALRGLQVSPEALSHAESLAGSLVNDTRRRFPSAWVSLTKDQEDQLQLDWRSLVYRAQAQGKAPSELVWSFLFSFNRHPELKTAWVACPIPERKFAVRVWEGLVRRSQAGG